MLKKLKQMFAGQPEPAAAIEAPAPMPRQIQRDANGHRVYHEFFVENRPNTDGNFEWLARVYSSAPPKEGRGAQESQAAAQQAALAWCNGVIKTIAR